MVYLGKVIAWKWQGAGECVKTEKKEQRRKEGAEI
jgi:hypothetical protein